MKTIHALKIAAMVPLAFMMLIMIIFGIGESLGSDLSGLMQLVPVILVGLIFTWSRFQAGDSSMWVDPLTILILPLAFSGRLLLAAEWKLHIQPAV